MDSQTPAITPNATESPENAPPAPSRHLSIAFKPGRFGKISVGVRITTESAASVAEVGEIYGSGQHRLFQEALQQHAERSALEAAASAADGGVRSGMLAALRMLDEVPGQLAHGQLVDTGGIPRIVTSDDAKAVITIIRRIFADRGITP